MKPGSLSLGELRQKYLVYFKERGHSVIPSSSLVPENDPTTLFTGSGMQPLVPYLLGKDHPQGTRITDSQKCFRSMDIEEVGDNRHTTFFEMLGNWSLGDYFKEEQLAWFFGFLTGEVGLDPENLYVTVFIGDETNNIPRDTESVAIWKKLFTEKGIDAKDVLIGSEAEGAQKGMQGGRIFYYEAKKNWWSRAGTPENMPPGEPGGPDSEVFYDFGTPHDRKFGAECHPNCDCGRFLEIGNSVFMQYLKKPDGTFGELPKRNVDFGGGLERIAMAAEHSPDIIAACHGPILRHLQSASGKTYGANMEDTRAFRIIADHMKAAVFLIADGVHPSNTDQGYFVRRLLRRSVRYADKLGISESSLSSVVSPIAQMYQDQYPEIARNAEHIAAAVADEEEKFRRTLARGLRVLASKLKTKSSGEVEGGTPERTVEQEMVLPQEIGEEINGTWVFDFYQTYGFPFELLTEELLSRKHITPEQIEVLQKEFNAAKETHQATSQQGSEQKFKGGLADHSDMSVRYHTATHLLHQALRDVLGPEVYQKGSNITPERLRFDFSFPRKMTEEEKKRVEDIVNEKITAALPVIFEDLPIEEAQKRGAIGLFEEKYGDKVRVYKVGEYSMEFCGGPHVSNTRELAGKFKIQKEEAVSQGVRRVKAVLEKE